MKELLDYELEVVAGGAVVARGTSLGNETAVSMGNPPFNLSDMPGPMNSNNPSGPQDPGLGHLTASTAHG